jgi:hypothetical protein
LFSEFVLSKGWAQPKGSSGVEQEFEDVAALADKKSGLDC